MAKQGRVPWRQMAVTIGFAVVGVALLLMVPLVVQADYVDVPNDGSSIQVAIGNADAGDVIRVEAGVFAENLVITKSLTLEGGYNSDFTSRTPRTTVIAPPSGRAIAIVGDGITVTIDGFEIRDGDVGGGNGGGVAIDVKAGSSVTITDNFIHDNTADGGGGIYAKTGDSSLVIGENDVMTNTTATGGDGAGIYARTYTGTFTLTDNEIRGNVSGDNYGGFYVLVRYAGVFTVENNLVVSNTAITFVSDDCGGFRFEASEDSHGTFSYNRVLENRAGDLAGGGRIVVIQNSSATMDDNEFRANVADRCGGLDLYVTTDSQVVASDLELEDNRASTYAGGGIVYASDASVAISALRVLNNQADDEAGGIRASVVNGASLKITDGHLEHNSTGTDGGGLYIAGVGSSTFQIAQTKVFSNVADGDGGGLYWDTINATGAVTVSNSVIEGNTAGGDYGGMYTNSAGDVIVQTTAISGNVAQGCGGGLGLDGSGMYILQRNRILENDAGGWCGDGLLVDGLEDVFSENNLIADNEGSGVYLVDAEIESANDTIAHNQEYGVMMTGTVPSLAELTGSIVWGQSTSLWRSSDAIFDFEVDYCDIQLGWPSGVGNIAESPRFVDAAAGDYHLQPNSPALNRLDPAVIYVPAVDLDGNERPYPVDSKADMGCYEAPWESVYLPLVIRD
jgi:hypothetical protein